MEKIKNLLALEENKISIKHFLLLLTIAYIFSVGLRFIWVYQFSGNESSIWNNHLMINTNDGYQWAEGARDILAQNEKAEVFPATTPISKITAFFAKILPFDFETILLYIPAYLGSLLVVPIMLIGRSLGQNYLGFVAALVGGIAWSYYNRTMAGYFDTDMLVIVLPTFVLWSLILAVTHNKNRYLLITAFFIIVYSWWYGGSYSLNLSMAAMLFIYTMIFDRKNKFNYKLLSFILIAIMSIPLMVKIIIFLLLFMVFHLMKEKADKYVIPVLVVAVLGMLVTGGLGTIFTQLDRYIFRSLVADEVNISLQFFNVVQTVREAGQIPFEMFGNRISGHPLTMIISTIGYILLAIRYPVMWLALPMMGLGFLALKGGLRFTVYAVPVNALGIAFLIIWMSQIFKKNLIARSGAIFLATAAVLYPNIKHIVDYRVPTVFTKQEVTVLDRLNAIADKDDYTLAWWDYGYPIRYYSNTRTLVDGGRHNGDENFPVSFALTYPQTESANMARLGVEYLASSLEKRRQGTHVQQMMEDYGYKDPNLFLQNLKSKEFKLPEKIREVYYYLPMRMLSIYPTVRLFSNLDLATGKQFAQPFMYESSSFRELDDKIVLGNGLVVDKKTNTIQIGNQQVPLNALFITLYDNSGKLRVQQQNFNIAAPISLIYMKSYNKFLVLDQQTLNSAYIQLFVFENYDRELFEPVILDPLAKVYRLKK